MTSSKDKEGTGEKAAPPVSYTVVYRPRGERTLLSKVCNSEKELLQAISYVQFVLGSEDFIVVQGIPISVSKCRTTHEIDIGDKTYTVPPPKEVAEEGEEPSTSLPEEDG